MPTIVAVLVAGVLVAGGVGAVGSAAPAIGLAVSGHWVVNKVANTVVHVDGGTLRVDAQVEIPAAATDPLLVTQNDQQGFVVARDRVVVFGRSTLTVDTTVPHRSPEIPVPVETRGGPYLVYRAAGTVVRLGGEPLTMALGGPLDRPVWTDAGTVWLRRADLGTLCSIGPGATQPTCDTQAPDGALTVTSDLPAFVSSERDAVQVIEPPRRDPVGLGTDVPRGPLVADRDTRGRLPFVVSGANQLVIADSSGVPAGRAGVAALPVELGPGRFTAPVAADGIVAVLDESTNRLLVFDADGRQLAAVQLPPGVGPASIVRGADGRIYVDDADGTATHVVGPDGSVTSVQTGEGLPGAVTAPPPTDLPAPPPAPGPPSAWPGGSGAGPAQNPVPNPPPHRPPNPVPLPALAAPAGLSARLAADGSVDASWAAVDGGSEPVRYVVRTSPGGERPAAGASAVLPGPGPGATMTVEVRADTDTRTSGWSGPVSVVGVGPPGAPVGPAITWLGGSRFAVSWTAADLNGGELVAYEVTTPWGATARTTTTRVEMVHDECYEARVTVYAITRSPSGGAERVGPGAMTAVPSGNSCAPLPTIDISPTATGARFTVDGYGESADVERRFGGPATCILTVEGQRYWSGACTSAVTFTITGLLPGTTYSAIVTANNSRGSGSTTPLRFTTSPAAVTTPTTRAPASTTRPPGTTTSRPSTSRTPTSTPVPPSLPSMTTRTPRPGTTTPTTTAPNEDEE